MWPYLKAQATQMQSISWCRFLLCILNLEARPGRQRGREGGHRALLFLRLDHQPVDWQKNPRWKHAKNMHGTVTSSPCKEPAELWLLYCVFFFPFIIHLSILATHHRTFCLSQTLNPFTPNSFSPPLTPHPLSHRPEPCSLGLHACRVQSCCHAITLFKPLMDSLSRLFWQNLQPSPPCFLQPLPISLCSLCLPLISPHPI